MGKYLSKEEIIIAQNNAVENQMHKYEMPVIIVVTIFGIIVAICVWRYYRHRIKKWMSRHVSDVLSASPTAAHAGTTQPHTATSYA